MNTKIVGFIVAIVVVGGIVYVTTSNNKVSKGEYATVGDAVNSGKNLKCEYATNQAGYSSKATYYISGENVRMEVMAINTTSFMILTKDKLHTWNDLNATPRVVTLALSAGGASEAVVTSLMRTPISELSCTETNINSSLFTPPA